MNPIMHDDYDNCFTAVDWEYCHKKEIAFDNHVANVGWIVMFVIAVVWFVKNSDKLHW